MQLPTDALPPDIVIGYANEKPLFMGHYWLQGTPALLAPQVACLDYSAGKDGPLVAYRWQGETQLRAAHFVV